MKQLILMTTICLMMSGCNYLSGKITILAIQYYSEDGVCIYTTNQSSNFIRLKFIAPCGIFSVGDTLKIVKQ